MLYLKYMKPYGLTLVMILCYIIFMKPLDLNYLVLKQSVFLKLSLDSLYFISCFGKVYLFMSNSSF